MKSNTCCQAIPIGACGRSRSHVNIDDEISKKQRFTDVSTEKEQERTSMLQARVIGMDCSGCAAEISAALAKISNGILSHAITIADSKLEVFFDNSVVTAEAIKSVIESSGYRCELTADGVVETLSALAKQEECDDARSRFFLSCLYAVVLHAFSWLAVSFNTHLNSRVLPGLQLIDLISLFLLIPLLYNLDTIYASAITAGRSGCMNSNTLVVCAITVSVLYSLLALAVSMYNCASGSTETFFETAGELSALTFLGRWMETFASTMTTSPLSGLLGLIPERARRLELEEETLVTTSQLRLGDVLVVQVNERFPADCTVLDGSSLVDDSAIHGDFMPVHKQEGAEVFAGTTNLSCTIHCVVRRTGMKTHLGQTTKLLLNAQVNKSKIELLAERVASRLVPVLLGLSLCTFLFWLVRNPLHYVDHEGRPELGRLMLSLKLGISVLVVACPCALTIATPTAVMVGTAAAAKMGVLIKGASVLECLDNVSDVVFDKTGTLTKGQLSVSRVQFASRFTEEQKREIWHMMFLAESALQSAHPICQAIESFYRKHIRTPNTNCMQVVDVADVSGSGLICLVKDAEFFPDASRLVMGNHTLCEGQNVLLPILCQKPGDTSEACSTIDCQTRMYVAVNGLLICTLSFHDDVKEDSRKTIGLLRSRGKTVWMLTGDDGRTAHEVAARVGIASSNVLSQCTIARKADFIISLQARHKVVAMVGDGVNDSLALTTADVGISLAGSSAVARESADIVLMKHNSIRDVLTSFNLAQQVCLKVKYNLFWAIGWNILVIPFAMGLLLPWHVYIPPAMAAFIMSLSCISIILSSLTLRGHGHSADLNSSAESLQGENARYQSSLRKLFRNTLMIEMSKTNRDEVLVNSV